jgi:hypothetical protein
VDPDPGMQKGTKKGKKNLLNNNTQVDRKCFRSGSFILTILRLMGYGPGKPKKRHREENLFAPRLWGFS